MDHKISHNNSKKLGTTDRRTVIIATILLVTVAKTTGGVGSAKQLSQLGAGANNQILGNNTEIGNPNAGKAASTQEKINAATPKTGLPSNPTGKGQK